MIIHLGEANKSNHKNVCKRYSWLSAPQGHLFFTSTGSKMCRNQNKTKQKKKKNVNAQKYKPSDLPVIFTSLTWHGVQYTKYCSWFMWWFRVTVAVGEETFLQSFSFLRRVTAETSAWQQQSKQSAVWVWSVPGGGPGSESDPWSVDTFQD